MNNEMKRPPWHAIVTYLVQIVIVCTLAATIKLLGDVGIIKRDYEHFNKEIVDAHDERMAMDARVDSLEQFAAQGDRFTATEAAELKAEIKEWTIGWLRGDLVDIKADLNNLKNDMQAVRTDIATIKAQKENQ
jgi:capsule polysaccharide export protein KpsE/RkpR